MRQFRKGPLHRHAALDEHCKLVAHVFEFRKDVTVDENGLSLITQAEQQVANLASANGIDAVGRLVEQQQFWIMQERLSQTDTLLHALGEGSHFVRSPSRHTYEVEHLADSLHALTSPHARQAPVVVQRLNCSEIGGEAMVFGQIADAMKRGLVADGTSQHSAFDGRRPDDRHQDFDQGRLPRTVGTQQAEDLPGINSHRYPTQGLHLAAKGLGGVCDFDDGRHVKGGVYRYRIPPCVGHYHWSTMTCKHKTLSDFMAQLETQGEVRRIAGPVSPLIAAAAMAVAESREEAPHHGGDAATFDRFGAHLGGQALRFDQVEGCDFPLVMNVFGSWSRMHAALGQDVSALSARIEALAHMSPPKGPIDAIRRLKMVLPVMRAGPRRVRTGVCQEVVRLTERSEVDLTRLPLIKCWPLDGDPTAVDWPMSAQQAGTARGQGRYITLAGMHTIHADDRNASRPASHNIGMYRAQLIDETHLAMHWHLHHDGAAHWRSWKAIGEPMPICICLGGEPVLPWAATAPLPPGISELLMAGFVQGRGIPLVEAKTVPLRVPANSEIVIEGWVRTDAGGPGWDPAGEEPIGPGAVLEGPFGDHTGYYSLPDRYPVVDVTAITHRREAIFPATVVGPPPQEDYWLGKTTERVFLPLLQTLIPDLVDYNLPAPGCFHNWAVLGIRKAYALQARRVMHAVWGAGQMAWTKCVIVVEADEVDVHDLDAVLRAVFTHTDMSRDIELVNGPLDILDHAAQHLGAGGKIGIDATPRIDGECVGTGTCLPPTQPSQTSVEAMCDAIAGDGVVMDVPAWGCDRCIVVAGDAFDPGAVFDAAGDWNGLVVLLDSHVDVRYRDHVWFHLLAGMDPKRDFHAKDGRAVIDARTKQSSSPVAGPIRQWPPFLGWLVAGQ